MKLAEKAKKILLGITCTTLIMAMMSFTTGCDNAKNESDSNISSQQGDAQTVGEGKTQFDFSVTDKDGNETQFDVHTDKTTVGEALEELNIISGDESEYGLYVKTVNGITLDFNKDGYYWAFYINGEYAQNGVDSTDIKDGETYAFKAEKG